MSAMTDFRLARDAVFQSEDTTRIKTWAVAWGISLPSDAATLFTEIVQTEGETTPLGAKADRCKQQMIATGKEKRKEELDSHGK